MRRLILAALVALGLLVGTSIEANATTYNVRWAGTSVYYQDLTADSAVSAAVNDWNSWRTGANFNLYATSSSMPFKIVWYDLAHPVAGEAWMAWSGSTMVACELRLDIDLRGDYWLTRAVASHESGHCLGLAHTDYWDSIMSTTNTGFLYQPTEYDNADIRYLYGVPGTTTTDPPRDKPGKGPKPKKTVHRMTYAELGR